MCLKKSTLLLLRFNLSIFFSLIYLGTLSQVPPSDMFTLQSLFVFIIVHVFYYPASHAYNSYYDKDIGPIGGLKAPPQPTEQLFWTAIIFKGIAIVWSYFVNIYFMGYIALNMGLSVAYSHPRIRLKSYPIICCLMIGICYGYFGVVGMSIGISGIQMIHVLRIHLVGVTSAIGGFAVTPLSQIFQVQFDKEERGEASLAACLGPQKSVWFASILYGIVTINIILFFLFYYPSSTYLVVAIALIISAAPVIPFIIRWIRTWSKNKEEALSYETLMVFIKIIVACVNLFLCIVIGYSYYIKLELKSWPEWQL